MKRFGALRWMTALLILSAAWLQSTKARAQDPDPWFGRDKAKHFAASAVIAAGGYTVGRLTLEERPPSLAVGAGLALSAGVGKELWDASGHGDPSWRDLTWDVVGTSAGLALAWGLDLLLSGSSSQKASQPAVMAAPQGLVLRF